MGATSPPSTCRPNEVPDFSYASDLRLIAAFIDAEYGEDNAPDHPSATLRRYAERLRAIADDWPAEDEDSSRQAEVAWVVEDILDKYHCLPSEAYEFLDDHEDEIQLAMIERGWSVIRDCCEFATRDDDVD